MAEITTGAPGLTELGKRIEMLRIERGLSKQHLARHAGTSRQQLWRVMTGKSELTPTLRLRIADALDVAAPELGAASTRTRSATETAPMRHDLADYVANADSVSRTLATMPAGEHGWRVKRAYLDALEDAARASGHTLDARFFDLRRRVLAGEL
jgi:transcriptional regulator with XRE-family HTH domain